MARFVVETKARDYNITADGYTIPGSTGGAGLVLTGTNGADISHSSFQGGQAPSRSGFVTFFKKKVRTLEDGETTTTVYGVAEFPADEISAILREPKDKTESS